MLGPWWLLTLLPNNSHCGLLLSWKWQNKCHMAFFNFICSHSWRFVWNPSCWLLMDKKHYFQTRKHNLPLPRLQNKQLLLKPWGLLLIRLRLRRSTSLDTHAFGSCISQIITRNDWPCRRYSLTNKATHSEILRPHFTSLWDEMASVAIARHSFQAHRITSQSLYFQLVE